MLFRVCGACDFNELLCVTVSLLLSSRPSLTGVHVGAKCKCAVLHIKRKTENLQVAGRDEPQHPVPADVTCVVDVDVRTGLRDVVIHAGRVGRGGVGMKDSDRCF